MFKIVIPLFYIFMTLCSFILILSLITNNFGKNESFEDTTVCEKITEGECNSKLCPKNCKIQHSNKNDKCYCVERK
jgi:hypothetical protein